MERVLERAGGVVPRDPRGLLGREAGLRLLGGRVRLQGERLIGGRPSSGTAAGRRSGRRPRAQEAGRDRAWIALSSAGRRRGGSAVGVRADPEFGVRLVGRGRLTGGSGMTVRRAPGVMAHGVRQLPHRRPDYRPEHTPTSPPAERPGVRRPWARGGQPPSGVRYPDFSRAQKSGSRWSDPGDRAPPSGSAPRRRRWPVTIPAAVSSWWDGDLGGHEHLVRAQVHRTSCG